MPTIIKILIFSAIIPGTFTVWLPYWAVIQKNTSQLYLNHLGIFPILLGVGLYIWCVWTFWKLGNGTPSPQDPPKKLVVKGPYGMIRNPMYVSIFSILLGEVILFQSLLIIKILIAFSLIVSLFVLYFEEPILLKQYGSTYRHYINSVGRWLPHISIFKTH
ncbi:MAG: isoprenylcysteine carboxylmethyltransferase family protein [Methylococcaceae bacterium]